MMKKGYVLDSGNPYRLWSGRSAGRPNALASLWPVGRSSRTARPPQKQEGPFAWHFPPIAPLKGPYGAMPPPLAHLEWVVTVRHPKMLGLPESST